MNIFARAFQKQGVTHLHDDIVQLPRYIPVPPVQGQRIDPVPSPQPQVTQPSTDHSCIRGNQNLDRRGLDRAHLIQSLQVGIALQGQQFRDLGAKDHAVAGLKRHGAQVAAQRRIAPHHVDQPHTIAFEKLDVCRLAPDQVRIERDDRLGEEFSGLA